jgi:hypothetical protein
MNEWMPIALTDTGLAGIVEAFVVLLGDWVCNGAVVA